MRYSVRLMPARGTQGFRKYGRYRTVTEISGLRAIAFSSRRLPMKHHGQTTSDTTSIGSSVAPALAAAGIGFSSIFEEKTRTSRRKGEHCSPCRRIGNFALAVRTRGLPLLRPSCCREGLLHMARRLFSLSPQAGEVEGVPHAIALRCRGGDK